MTPIQHLMTKKVANNNVSPYADALHTLYNSFIRDLKHVRSHPEIHEITAAEFLDAQIAAYEEMIVNQFPEIYS
jgi:hypothetical protein